MRAKVSFDLLMEPEMSFVEGTYRLPGRGWEVFIVTRDGTISAPRVLPGRWGGSATGLLVEWPTSVTLNRDGVLETLAGALGVTGWDEVRGPDSMSLR